MSDLIAGKAFRFPNRRVVTGLDDAGRSCIAIDGPAPVQPQPDRTRLGSTLLWETQRSPADNRDPADKGFGAFSLTPAAGGTKFIMAEFPGSNTLAKLSKTERLERILPPPPAAFALRPCQTIPACIRPRPSTT